MMLRNSLRNIRHADRLDVRQSVHGGSAYLRSLMDRIPNASPNWTT